MGKKITSGLFLAVLFFSSCFLACKKGEKNVADISSPLDTPGAGELRVVNATPQGKTAAPSEAQALVVIFDRAMAALEALPEGKGRSILELDPPCSGKSRWLGTKTFVFTPETRFPYSTEVKVTIPAGIRSQDGSVLKGDYVWSFETAPPRLVNHFPRDNQKWLKLETEVILVFNQAIEKEKVRDFISLSFIDEQNKPGSVDFRVSYPPAEKLKEAEIEAPPEQSLLLEPVGKLQPGLTYSVTLRRGLRGKEGPLGMEKSTAFRFETFRRFRFEGLEKAEEHNPDAPLQFKFSNRVIYKDLMGKIHFNPPVEIPDYYAEWDDGNDVLWISVPLQPETEYGVSIDPELTDEFGNKLGEKIDLKVTTSAYPPMISMTTGQGILEAYGELKYPFHALNAERVYFQGARLKKEQVIPLLLQPKIFWSSDKFVPSKGFFQVEKNLPLRLSRNKLQIVPLDLQGLLPDKAGLVFVQIDSLLPEDKYERYPKAFIQSTELGISAKFSPENNLIWVTELRTGNPVLGAVVEIRDDLNKVKWNGVTDKNGKAETPGWKVLGLRSRDPWREPQQWIFVSRNKDVAFISSEWGTGIDPYRFRISYEWFSQPVKIQGNIFTERGIYRAGEDIHIKGIIRKNEKGQWRLPTAKEVECEIQDPFEKAVLKEKVALDDFASFALDFSSAENSSLGYYQVIVKIPPEKQNDQPVTLNGSFRIEAFRPAEFEVLVRTQKDSFLFNRDYEADIRASYLFGGAMADQPVSWHVRLNRTAFSPPGHKGYIFGNELDWGDDESQVESRLAASGEGRLDAAGKLKVKIPLVAEKEKDSVMATLEATVTSPSRRSISNRIQTLVHRGDFYIGLKPGTSFLKKGEKLGLDVIASTPQGSLLPEKKIRLKLVKREWRSVRKSGVGGRFKWMTEKEDLEISGQEVQTKNEPVTVSFLPEKSGFYFLLASAEDSLRNTITTTTSFYITGQDYVPWDRRDDDSIELVADADSYRPGEKARILVKSPYEKAKALVTIERELILETRVLDIEGTASQIEVPISPEYVPNVFVSVLLVQGRSEKVKAEENQDVGKPSFKVGYVNLGIDPAEKRLSLEIQKDKEEYKPRETVTLKFNVRTANNEGCPASLSVAVVDVGVLNLIGYQTPDPFSQFYGERPLSVKTSETRLHVVGQREFGEKGEEPGGGAGAERAMAAPAQLAEVELRGDFKSTAYWNPSLLTDDKGEAQVTFALPDNLTTFRVMAVAQTKESHFGRNESTFRVSKRLLLQSALPRFARVGDQFEGGVVIHNFSAEKGNVVLEMQASGIRLLDKRLERRFSLAPGESQEVLFAFGAEEPGLASFAFRARMGEETDGLEAKIPLKLPRPTETVALTGQTQDSEEEKISLPENVFPKESRLEVQAGSSALLGLKGSLDYLRDYPYVCLEQRLSGLLPYLVAPQVLLDFGLSALDKEQIQSYVRQGLEEIYNYQKDSGGFGLWPDSSAESPFNTCYAAFALIKAKETGYLVNQERLTRAVAYLKEFLKQEWLPDRYPYGRSNWNTTKAFSLYVLALVQNPQPAYAERLFSEKDGLSLFGKALLLKALFYGKGSAEAQDILMQELLNKVKVNATDAHFEEAEGREDRWIYSSNARTTALILQTMIETSHDHPLLPAVARWLVEKKKVDHWASTQDNFYVFYALNDYYRKYEKITADFRGKMAFAGKVLLDEVFKAKDLRLRKAQVGLSEFGAKDGKELPLKIEKKGDGILYYGARLTYAPQKRLSPRDEGFAVQKRIETLDGKTLEVVPGGSLILVTIEVAVPQESLYVVVEDPLPAGLEAVNPTFVTESEEQQRKLAALDAETPMNWWQGFNHIEMHDDRVLLFADSLAPGLHVHRYLARAVSYGNFLVPGTKAEEMYSPEVFGRGAEISVKVAK